MANELVKEIEEALEIMEEHQSRLHAEKEEHGWETHVRQAVSYDGGVVIFSALQRAREALRWIPVSERLPEKSGNYQTTIAIQPIGADGLLYMLSFDYFDAKTKQWHGRGSELVAWREKPAPYTPEEK